MEFDRPYDFSGWATKYNIKCSDGRTIRPGSMKECDGIIVPLVYNHSHSDIGDVLGHTLLEDHPEGMRCYGWFNDTDAGKQGKAAVENGDITALSIYANHLEHQGHDVVHGCIREVSLVLAGANPGALIDSFVAHGELSENEAVIYNDDNTIEINHGDVADSNGDDKNANDNKDATTDSKDGANLSHSDEGKEKNMADEAKKDDELINLGDEVERIVNGLPERDKEIILAAIAEVANVGEEKEGEGEMKHNIFDKSGSITGNDMNDTVVLEHSDEEAILRMAKSQSCGSFKEAIAAFERDNNVTDIAHSFDQNTVGYLFDDYTNIPTGAPNTITRGQEWVADVLNGVTKTPNTRIRTRHVDARTMTFAKGYVKGTEKQKQAALTVIKRETTPQTVYVTDELHKDDVDDITDFDSVQYQYDMLRNLLNETLAMAILVGDLRDDDDPQKISEDHIRPIWKESQLMAIRRELDLTKYAQEINGNGNAVNFAPNYIFSEALIAETLDARTAYHGSGNLVFYAPTSVVNKMLLAKDLNGRRIYNNIGDLASALNVRKIVQVEQFENLTRETTGDKVKQLIGIMVNLADYHMGAVKKGQISKFDDFDIHYNKMETLLETRASGSLTKLLSAIIIEQDVTA